VDISGKGGTWRARVTDAGSFYLEHGYHPDHLDRGRPGQVPPDRPGAATAPPRRPQATSTRDTTRAADPTIQQATALIERLQHEGGTVLVESPDEPTRALYRRIIHAAKRHRLVPDGFHLRHTGRDRGDIVIRLYEDSRPDDTDWNRIRLNTVTGHD